MGKYILLFLTCFLASSQGLEKLQYSFFEAESAHQNIKRLAKDIFPKELMNMLFKYDDLKTNLMNVAFQAWIQTVGDVMYFDKRPIWMQLHECLWDQKSFLDLDKCMKFSNKKSRGKTYFEKILSKKLKSDGEVRVRERISRLHAEMLFIKETERILHFMDIGLRNNMEWFRPRHEQRYLLDEIRDLICYMPKLHDYAVSLSCKIHGESHDKDGFWMLMFSVVIFSGFVFMTCITCVLARYRKEEWRLTLGSSVNSITLLIADFIYIIFSKEGPFLGRAALVIARRKYKTSNIYMYIEASTNRLVLVAYDKTMIPNKSKECLFLGYETHLKNPYKISNEAVIFSHQQAFLKDSTRGTSSHAIQSRQTKFAATSHFHSITSTAISEVLTPAGQEIETTSSLTLANMQSIKLCIRRFSSILWESHSNLRIITADTEKMKNGKSIKKRCIVFYCLSKGYIPLGEKPFPKFLPSFSEVFETDVREGYFVPGPKSNPTTSRIGYLDRFNEPLCMGSNIGEESRDETGTLGLFVNMPGNMKGFITCCHVLFDCTLKEHFRYLSWYKDAKCNVLQPGKSAFCDRPDQKCGEIEKALFYPNRTPSVDAALVKITDRIPTSGHFAIRNKNQVKELGYKENAYPNYIQGKVRRVIRETDLDLPVLKSGSTTGLTRSYFKLNGAEVRIFNEGNILGMKDAKPIVMKGQYEIEPGSKQNPFFIPGDSGSAVFLREPDKSLVCIGIAIGTTTYDTTIVTPIGPVLDCLGLDDACVTHFK